MGNVGTNGIENIWFNLILKRQHLQSDLKFMRQYSHMQWVAMLETLLVQVETIKIR